MSEPTPSLAAPRTSEPAPARELTTREKVLEAAEALFAARGFAGVGMSAVASDVGIGKSSLFHHFATKAELYEAVLGRALGRVEVHITPALTSQGTPAEKLERLLEGMVDALAEHPGTARLFLWGLVQDDPVAVMEGENRAPYELTLLSLILRFQALLREGMEFGVFRELDVGEATQTLIGATVYHFASGPFGEDVTGGPLFTAEAVRRRKREVIALFLHGFAVPAQPESSQT